MFDSFKQIFNFFQDICINVNEPIKCAIWIKKEELKELRKISEIRKIIEKNGLNKCYSCSYSQSILSIKYKNGSRIDFLTPSKYTRGLRYTFSVYDTTLDNNFVNYIITPASIFPPKSILFIKDKCNHCICKTCALAYENGGAEGCGDCLKCDLIEGCISCRDYYNADIKKINYERRGLNENENFN